jgi:uncharacterized protein (TIGR03437 family)
MIRSSIYIFAALFISIPAVEGQTQTVGLFKNDVANVSPGYTLLPPMHNGYTYLIDNNGQVINSWNGGNSEPGRMAYLLPNGHLMRADSLPNEGPPTGGGEGGQFSEYDWAGNLVWRFQYATSTYATHHDFKVLPNGNIIALMVELKTPADMTAAGFRPNMLQPGGDGNIVPDAVVEIQPVPPNGGNIVWQWHVWDHLVQNYDSTKSDYGSPAAHPERIDPNATYPHTVPEFWNHMNAIDYNPALDQLLLSVRNGSEVWIIDHSTTTAQAAGHTGGTYGKGGDLLYRWGNPAMYSTGTPANQTFYESHDAQWIAPGLSGAGDVLLFDNGANRSGGAKYSSADEFTPAVDSSGDYPLASGAAWGPAKINWTYYGTGSEQYYETDIGGTQRLPNGNTNICYGVFGVAEEVTPAGEIVWKYVNPVEAGNTGALTQGHALDPDPNATGEYMNAMFKVRKYAPDYAGLVGQDLTPKGTLEKYAFATVNGAALKAGDLASGVIMSLFGTSLAASTAVAQTTPLPTDLGGATVQITDSAGVTQSCPLFYASPKQINLLVPDNVAAGPATLTVKQDSGSSTWANVAVESVAPGLFAMNANGQGVGAIIGLRVDGSGNRTDVPIFSCGASGTCTAVPIDLSTGQVYLSLYGTGIRGFSSLSNMTVTIGGVSVPVLGAAAQSQFPGLDQVNVGPLPSSLAGTGAANLVLKVDARTANTVTVSFK